MSAKRSAGLVLAALVLVAGCATPAAPTPTPSPAEPAPSASVSPSPEPSEPASPTPSSAPSVDWQAADVPESANGSAAVTIVPGGEGLIAIGVSGFGSLLWTSPDGRTWTDVTPEGFASFGITNVVEFDGGLVGVGREDPLNVDSELAAVYRSDDGLAWRMVPGGDEMRGQMIDVVATADGLFAVGGVPGADSAGVWRSADGETWERTGGDFDHAFLWAIAEGGPGLVAVGWRRAPEPSVAVWTSTDGASWSLAPDPEGFELAEATDVLDLDGTLVMVGSSLTSVSRGHIWVSDDGLTWQLADVAGGMHGHSARTLVRTPAGLVAVGSGPEVLSAAAWISTDGRSWQPLGDPEPNAYFQSAIATDDGLLLIGATQAGTLETGIETHAMIWTAAFED